MTDGRSPCRARRRVWWLRWAEEAGNGLPRQSRPNYEESKHVTVTSETGVPLQHTDRFFIDGEWATPSSDATFDVIDSSTEQVYFRFPRPRPPTSTGR